MDLSGSNWKRACTHADLLRVYAAITFVIGIAIGIEIYRHYSAHTSVLKHPFIYTVIFSVLMSPGAFFNLKIFSAGYCVSAAVIGGWVIVSGLHFTFDKPPIAGAIPISMLIIQIGLLFILPMYSTWRAWKALK